MEEGELYGDVGRARADRLLREAGTAVFGHLVLLGIVLALVWDALPAAVVAACAVK
jgi:predicted small integral membrane protein